MLVKRWRAPRARKMKPQITPREREVILLITEGLIKKEIGARLGISGRTVEKFVQSACRKLGARTMAQLVAEFYELEYKLFRPPVPKWTLPTLEPIAVKAATKSL